MAAELKTAGASLVLAMAAAENGDWAAAPNVIDDRLRNSSSSHESSPLGASFLDVLGLLER